jgi:hypothetical protein
VLVSAQHEVCLILVTETKEVRDGIGKFASRGIGDCGGCELCSRGNWDVCGWFLSNLEMRGGGCGAGGGGGLYCCWFACRGCEKDVEIGGGGGEVAWSAMRGLGTGSTAVDLEFEFGIVNEGGGFFCP